MTGFFTCVKGISGSGKSTRILQLFLYLRNELNYTFEDVYYNKKKCGILIKELNVIYLGKFYKTEGIERLQGYDSVTAVFGSAENASKYIKETLQNYSILVEGAGITGSNRYRPLFAFEYLSANKIFIQYYNYSNQDDYLERIVGRSGEIPKKGTMWNKNLGFISDCKKSFVEKDCIVQNGFDANEICVFENNFDENVNDFGVKYLKFIGKEVLIEEYKQYCIDHDYTKINNFKVFQSQIKPTRRLF